MKYAEIAAIEKLANKNILVEIPLPLKIKPRFSFKKLEKGFLMAIKNEKTIVNKKNLIFDGNFFLKIRIE